MNPKASFGNIFASLLRGIIPLLKQDSSTNQFQCTTLSELEFHNKIWLFESLLGIMPDKSTFYYLIAIWYNLWVHIKFSGSTSTVIFTELFPIWRNSS
jgi:hypothetical protein